MINKIDVDKPDVTEKGYCKCNRVVCIVVIGLTHDFAMLRSIIVFRGHQNGKDV